jgi:hypothetical protein
MTEGNSPSHVVAQLPRVRDPQYREVYSNSSATQLGPFDISLIFQKVSELMPGTMAVTDQVSVTFSPQQFKALVKALSETLMGYEAAFGELKIPEQDIAPNRDAKAITAQIEEARKSAQPTSSSEPQPPVKQSRAARQKKAI